MSLAELIIDQSYRRMWQFVLFCGCFIFLFYRFEAYAQPLPDANAAEEPIFVPSTSLASERMHKKNNKTLEKKVEALLARMTLDEKIGQLTLMSNGPLMDWPALASGSVGALMNFNNAQDIARAQDVARKTRLGIPLLFGIDVIHGFRTQFPVPLGEAAAFDPDLSQEVAKAMAEEAAYIGLNWTYAPMADLSRDVRWGRIVEGFGEDPYLGSLLTAARVRGLQQGGLIATVKHFAGYGAPVGGRDYGSTLIPENEFRNFYLPPYQAGIEAGAGSVMSAFNALNGHPSTANKQLLTGILRDQLSFGGFVTSDWGAIPELIAHGVVKNGEDAAITALKAGVDMDMAGGVFRAHLAQAIRSGRLSEAVVDRAVRRVLLTKYRFNLFDNKPIDPSRTDAIFPTEASRKLAYKAAVKSFVLLKNDKSILPLSSAAKTIAVVGPLADAPCEQLGPHAARGQCEDGISLRKAIEQQAHNRQTRVIFAPGCDLFCKDDAKIGEAVNAVRDSDVIVAVLGEPRDASGEAASKAYLDLPGQQGALLEALLGTGKPVVLVLMAGRPLDIQKWVNRLDAALMIWYPGTEGGLALADVLYGDQAPSGKLPLTYPRTIGQVPLYYNDLPSGRPHLSDNRFTYGYYDESHLPLYPFGWGLSYTSFAFSNMRLTRPNGPMGDIVITVTVRNSGLRFGEEVVQAYMRKPVNAMSRPLRELKAFSRVALDAGQSQDVTLRIPLANLGFYEGEKGGRYTIAAGDYEFYVGGDSNAALLARTLVPKAKTSATRLHRQNASLPH